MRRCQGVGHEAPQQRPIGVCWPVSLSELSSQIVLHKFNSRAWLRHIQKTNAALNGLTPEKISHLGPGETYVWPSKATAENCLFVRKHLHDRTAAAIMSHGVQLPDVFEVLPREEAQREFQRELATMRALILKLFAEKPLVTSQETAEGTGGFGTSWRVTARAWRGSHWSRGWRHRASSCSRLLSTSCGPHVRRR